MKIRTTLQRRFLLAFMAAFLLASSSIGFFTYRIVSENYRYELGQ